MSRISRRTAVSCLALFLAACASSGTGAPSTAQSGGSGGGSGRGSANVISAEELAGASDDDLYAAVHRLRPAFLQSRAPASLTPGTAPEFIQVYIDGVRAGDTSVLHQLRPSEVREVRHLSATEATQLYGTGNVAGAISIKRK